VNDLTRPIEMATKSAEDGSEQTLRTFTSYSFDRNMLIPASPFRFTAEGVDKDVRQLIRSADTANLYVKSPAGVSYQLASGIIDETDTHVTPAEVGYVLTGRDTIGQLVDNSSIDAQNRIVHAGQTNGFRLIDIATFLIQNTRIPTPVSARYLPNAPLLFQTNPGETKINSLQRYLEFCNCLAWNLPNGQLAIGKPNMVDPPQGTLKILSSDPSGNNILEARVRRNINTVIRQIAVQIQELGITDPGQVTIKNADPSMAAVALAGRSVYRLFSQGNGADSINQLAAVGNNSGFQTVGANLARREIAMDNMKILDVEAVVDGHIAPSGIPYNVDQTYNTIIEEDDVDEVLYVYACKYDYNKTRGPITTMRLCKLGTIVADVPQRAGKVS
jgi:prophage tail gpP-like protein